MSNERAAQISARIAGEVAKGKDIMEACRAVLGAHFDQMIDELYQELRK